MCVAVDRLYTHCLLAPKWVKLLQHRVYSNAFKAEQIEILPPR